MSDASNGLSFADHTAITRLRYDYAFGIDSRDYALLRSVFTDQITMDFSSYNGQPEVTLLADDWVQRVAGLFDGLNATQHTMTNPLVDRVDADTAHGRMSMQAAHFLDDRDFTIGGWYDDRVVRTAEGWKLRAVTLTVTWRRGDEAIMAEAVERAAHRPGLA